MVEEYVKEPPIEALGEQLKLLFEPQYASQVEMHQQIIQGLNQMVSLRN
jgi:hypothetical protein